MTSETSKNLATPRMLLIFGAFLVAGLIYIAVVALQGPAGDSDQSSGVDPELLVAFQSDPGTLTLIDSRSAEEYAASRIPGAINIPFDALETNEALLPADKEKPVIVHCRTGRRAGILKEQLEARGYTDVQVLSGKQIEWDDDQLIGLNPDAKSAVGL
jgi:phage shock protein E